MRGKNTFGRFTMPFELAAVSEGLEEDVQNPLAQWLDWYRYSPEATMIDPVYDVGDYDGGRDYTGPIRLSVMRMGVEQGQLYPNDRGFYTVDATDFIINESEFTKKLPGIAYSPDPYLKDRIVWRGKVFHPTLVNPRAHLWNTAVTVVVRCVQVNPEELVNDPQFNWIVKNVRKYGDFDTADFSDDDYSIDEYQKKATDVTYEVNVPKRREDYKWSPPPPEDDPYETP